MRGGRIPDAREEVPPMEAARFPAYLRLVARQDDGEATAAGAPARRRLLSRVELMQALDAMPVLAPRAPLSFLAVKVDGIDAVEAERGDIGVRLVSRGVGEALARLCRGTDIPGELDPGTFGVLLQGSGATAAAAVAARLTHHLNRLAFLPGTCAISVGAATGTGSHGRRLARAALETFDGVCG
jgi:GGDEF domain-containing protein